METNFLVVDIPMAYNVILGRPTLNAIKSIMAPYLLLILFELDDRKVGKLYGDPIMAREWYYVILRSLGRKEPHPTGDTSRPNRTEKKVAIEAIVVLSASAEEHRRPRPEATSEVMPVPLDPCCPEQTVQIGKVLDPIISDGIAGCFTSQPFKEKVYQKHGTPITLGDTTYDVGRR